jgi:hypothetical protein
LKFNGISETAVVTPPVYTSAYTSNLKVFTVSTSTWAVTMKKKREKWVVVRDTTGGGNRIYRRF